MLLPNLFSTFEINQGRKGWGEQRAPTASHHTQHPMDGVCCIAPFPPPVPRQRTDEARRAVRWEQASGTTALMAACWWSSRALSTSMPLSETERTGYGW